MSDRPSDGLHRESLPGSAEPLGATVTANGVNFALWSRHGERVEVCLYDERGERELKRLDLVRSRDVWHGFVPGLAAGLTYGYRVHGPHAPREGHRFNPNKLLIDPYARALTAPIALHETHFGYQRGHADGDLSFDGRDDAAFMPKCRIVAAEPALDAGMAPRTPWRDTVIYELHVKGYTRLCPYVPERLRGTYLGLASEPAIRHLRDLGVTAVELLPIAAFADEPHLVAKGLTNYWGYNPVALMAPEPRWAVEDVRAELRTAVRRLHEAGIEIILDVVFNHTGEGWQLGPTLSLKGIDNAGYYRLELGNESRYVDHAGCGNTLDVSRPHVRRLVLDTLRHWVRDYGIDGFRFDLATTLGREGDDAAFSAEAAFFAEVSADALLSQVKLIAEPWDIGPGGYRLGRFPRGWAEWNDRSRDAIRRFWRGDIGVVGDLATRLAGSSDAFAAERGPLASVNFVAAHDGMRLRDLVTYAGKHNEANGEDNRDGTGENHSASYGPEGPSGEASLRALRLRQMKNLLGTLLLAQGVPMLAMGDEVGHSQGGNNNAYAQDNALFWIDWGAVDAEGCELLAFTRQMIALRRRFPQLRRETFLAGTPIDGSPVKDVTWLAPDGREMARVDWESPSTHTLGMLLGDTSTTPTSPCVAPISVPSTQVPGETGSPAIGPLLLLFNAHDGEVAFRLPDPPARHVWSLLIDTAHALTPALPHKGGGDLALRPRSLMVLAAVWDAEAALDELCDLAGVEHSWHDLDGKEHHPSSATKRALLAALGFAVGTPEIEQASLAKARAARWRELLAPVIVARRPPLQEGEGHALVAPMALAGDETARMLCWSLHLEGGGERGGEVNASDLQESESAVVDGVARHCLELPLPGDLPLGYHTLTVAIGERAGRSTLIIAPDSCWLPDGIDEGERLWGVAHQLYSLRAERGSPDWGIGDFTMLGLLGDAVRAHGGAAVGVNPLHALSLAKPDDASPYSPSSRLFLNPLFIDVDAAEAFLSSAVRDQPGDTGQSGEGSTIDYGAVARHKLAALWQVYERFEESERAGHKSAAAFAAFLAEHGETLRRFATHQVLEEELGRAPSPAWEPYGDPESAAVAVFFAAHARRIRFHCWLQLEADRQLRLAANRGLKLGLYGDLAVGIDPHGADVWSEPAQFVRKASFGAPPDPFSAAGQDWGMLAFDPLHLRRSGYRPFRDMLAASMRHVHALRIDHVMWIERMFWIPHGAKPIEGTYVRFPRDELLAVLALESHRHRCLVVGEDLGTVPSGFRELMARERVLSYKLMAFERWPDGFYKRPDAYPPLSLATPASHDWPTLVGFWRGRDIEVRLGLGIVTSRQASAAREERARDRQMLVAALVDQGLVEREFPRGGEMSEARLAELVTAVHRFLARSPSALVMLNIEDLALATEQVNLPGPLVGYPCWRNRLRYTVSEILSSAAATSDLAAVAAERR